MYQFNIRLRARPEKCESQHIEIADGGEFETLTLPAASTALPMAISFEKAAEKLERLPRLFFEPDGSFVWVGQSDGNRWQVDGQMYDLAGRLQYAELKGNCPPAAFDQLLAIFTGSGLPLAIELVQHGVYLSEAEFQRFAEWSRP